LAEGRRVVATGANGCPALATYTRMNDGTYVAHSVQVLETVDGEITHIYAFLDTDLFAAFGLPLALP
jgi:RNA polymerase sigma-70 factor (ECF subfamily)